ncbi:GDSL-type esterase/lipase family protein [Corynebacterium timonense]|uniref:GDSL-like Lipase/Acylhydrolase family protein n=1 Tax=Corynebacterium timonense TaxID=441500 RepID=A0A1H1UMG5_9CORY|nr:GDSL-type esterase/lipase family protein [Corynebacterium timonense]SDS73665.1 GDSL-like Lipase/Acylhydrolase family protein [Corynebacterium timonense]
MKLARIAASVLAALSLVGAPAAQAAQNGNIVTFGDSYTANPDEIRNALRGIEVRSVQEYVDDYPSTGGCLQAPNNWPRKLSDAVGAPVADWSCTAQTSQSVLGRIDAAIEHGDIHPGTRSVVIAVGMNDYGPFGIAQGFTPWFPSTMRDDFVHNMQIAADKIRAVAPEASIVLSGSLAVSEPAQPHMFCPINVIPGAPIGFPLPHLQAVEHDNEHNQRAAADAIGAEFVEMRLPSAGHTSCNRDASQRHVAGFIDTTTPNTTMALHPSDAGSEFITQRLAPVV